MKDILSIQRTAYVCFTAVFAYCLLTIFYDKSAIIDQYYGLFLSHKLLVLLMCISGTLMAKFVYRIDLLQDLLYSTMILYVCAGEIFYPGYNLAFIQLIIALPLIFNFSGKKTIIYTILTFILFNVSLYFGQSQFVKADGYESFYLDVLFSCFTASCLSFFIFVLVKRINAAQIEEMREYYALGLQSSVFVHDAKASLIHTYRQLEAENQSSPIIEDSMVKLKSMLERSKHSTHSSLTDVYRLVCEEIKPYAERSKFDLKGGDISLPISEYYLKSILFNLISNSIRVNFDRGINETTIELQIQKKGFSVQDNGPGFSDGMIKSVLKGRVDSTSSLGTGLGILNSKKLVESFNGRFLLENTSIGGKVSVWFF